MTSPALAIEGKGGMRLYQHPTTGQTVPSVTTVLSVVDKPALPRWSALEVAKYAVEHIDSWKGLPPKDAVTLLKQTPWAQSKDAMSAGTNVHEYVEAILNGEEAQVPKEHIFAPSHGNAFINARAIIEELKPFKIAQELTCWSHQYGYAGSFDGIHLIDRGDGPKLYLTDLKTSKGVWPEYSLQIAAYRYADVVFNEAGEEIPMPKVDRCQIWHAPKEGNHAIVDIRADEKEFEAFLAALTLWRWKYEESDTVIPKTPKRTIKKTA